MPNSYRPWIGRGCLIAVAVASVIAAYALYFPWADGPYFDDWSSFNSLSLVVRSNILHYGRFPVHNPWVCGGLDLMTNPQNRVFSPFLLADLVLPPQWANLCTLMIYGTVGFIGCFWLLTALGCGRGAALIGSILFVNGSWFALHYPEGHIPYGAMQLVPLMMFLGARLGNHRHLIALADQDQIRQPSWLPRRGLSARLWGWCRTSAVIHPRLDCHSLRADDADPA